MSVARKALTGALIAGGTVVGGITGVFFGAESNTGPEKAAELAEADYEKQVAALEGLAPVETCEHGALGATFMLDQLITRYKSPLSDEETTKGMLDEVCGMNESHSILADEAVQQYGVVREASILYNELDESTGYDSEEVVSYALAGALLGLAGSCTAITIIRGSERLGTKHVSSSDEQSEA